MASERWDERYSKSEFAYGTEPNDFLVSVADRIPRGPVLMLGDGEGRNGVFLASRGLQVLAVDQSAIGLAKARQLASERGVRLRTEQADLRDYPIQPCAWTGIVSIFCHLPPSIRAPLHAAVVRGLVHGGVFVLEAPVVRRIWRCCCRSTRLPPSWPDCSSSMPRRSSARFVKESTTRAWPRSYNCWRGVSPLNDALHLLLPLF
jgi:SAM-dependent methyltransferase